MNKAELTGEYQDFSFFLYYNCVRCSEKGLLTNLKQQKIKELLAGSYHFSAEVLPAFSKLEIDIVKLKVNKVGGILLFSLLILVGIQSSLILSIKNRGGWV